MTMNKQFNSFGIRPEGNVNNGCQGYCCCFCFIYEYNFLRYLTRRQYVHFGYVCYCVSE